MLTMVTMQLDTETMACMNSFLKSSTDQARLLIEPSQKAEQLQQTAVGCKHSMQDSMWYLGRCQLP
jgi:hypothetical protein